MSYEEVKNLLEEKGQSHVLRFWGELDGKGRKKLLRQIEEIDWEILYGAREKRAGEIAPVRGLTLAEIGSRRKEFMEIGGAALAAGKVGAVLLAGGQGTRLGSDAPKGTFDIGITRPLYIFGLLLENLKSVCRATGARVPLYVMTSGKNDEETRAFFEEHGYFGYPVELVSFFVQDMAPVTDLSGKLLLEAKDSLALSPNGNGGWYSSMMRAGLQEDLKTRGVEWINVFSVDNVLQRIADPVFVGATLASGCKCGAKTVRKKDPAEKVGVLCLRDGFPDVIEYYELDEKTAALRREDGELLYSDGVILNYLFEVAALDKIATDKIPVHTVKKKAPCLDAAGSRIEPVEENAVKYETLILDMVRLTGSCLPFEVEREREFAPVKNRTGKDSVDTARILLEKNGVEL